MDEQCIHRGKATYCQIVCIDKNDNPVCTTNTEVQQQKISKLQTYGDIGSALFMAILVVIISVMALRATIHETRNAR
jgi:hypothetical protein